MGAIVRSGWILGRAPILAIAAALLLPLSVAAADDNDKEKDQGLTLLHLTQTAERQMKRDRLVVQLRAEATASDAKKVQAEINRAMTAALEKAKSVAGVKVESSGYSVYEENDGNLSSRWHGSQGLRLSGGDFTAVLGVAGDLQGMGLAMSGLSYELSPEAARTAEDELTSEALTRLRSRAERVASDLQLTLLRLRDVRVGNVNGEGPRPVMVMRGVALGAAAPPPPPAAEGGDATIQVSVDAQIVLGPGDQHTP